jgi:hypothetical protein
MRGKTGSTIDAIFEGRDYVRELPDSKFFTENKKYFDVIFSNNGSNEIMTKVKEAAKTFLLTKLKENNRTIDENTPFVLEYILGANISVISYWFNQGMKTPLEKVTDLVKEISITGPVKKFGKPL